MRDDFSETIQCALEHVRAALAEQDHTWSETRAALLELDSFARLSVDPWMLDEIDDACGEASFPEHAAAIPNAVRV